MQSRGETTKLPLPGLRQVGADFAQALRLLSHGGDKVQQVWYNPLQRARPEGERGVLPRLGGNMDDQTWGIIGHTWAVDALRHAIAQDRVPHALLFVGPAGVGKRTLARAFARALHCLAPDVAARPCGHCRPCELIANDAYPDVHLIETQRTPGKARERRDISIDQIRALQHQVSLKPYNGRWAVGIIADAHEMSDAAANCLLKTLEEPQARVVLVLTATDVTLLLPTIVSRCQVFPLRPLAREETRMALM